MSKNGKKKTWNMRLLAFALTMILAISPLVSGTYAEASSVQTLDVGDYKGDRAVSEWIVPTETGKIFAGWYTDDTFSTVYTETDGNAVAKFVDAKVLTVKKQLPSTATSTDTTMNIRFLTAIDSLQFKGVSFDIKVPESGKEWTDITEKVAYSSMLAEENGTSTEKFAKDEFGTEDAQFFVAHSLKGIPQAAFGHTITVTPSWKTMDGTTVTGTPLSFTINEALLEGSLFAEKVTIGERTEESAVQAWDISEIENNTLTGTNLTDGQVMWFKATGSDAVAQMTVTRNDTNGIYQPLAAIGVSDGINYGHVGVRAHGVIYNGAWIEHALSSPVLTTEGHHSTIELEIVLHNGQFLVYVDGIYVASVNVNQVITGATADTNLAFSIVMSTFNEGTTEFEFSNIRFATGEDAVDNFFLEKAGFAKQVTVNGATVTSALDKWDLSNIANGTLRTTYAMDSKAQPMYFAETGDAMLLKMTVSVTSDTQQQPVAGIYLNDGTNTKWMGIRGQGLCYDPGWWWGDGYWPNQEISNWGKTTADITIALKNGTLYFYVEGACQTVSLESLLPNLAEGADIAFGIFAWSESTYNYDMTFSNISFTTDADSVDDFFLENVGFASEVTVNGTTVKSALDKWDLSNIANGTLRTTYAMDSKAQPMYFAETGDAMLLKMTVSVTSDTQQQPVAGIYLNDGTNTKWMGIRGQGLCYDPGWWWGDGYWPNQEISNWGKTTADITIALKDGTLYFYVEGACQTVSLASLLPNLAEGADIAFGIFAWSESTYNYDMTFSNISFTTDAAEVETFITSQ